MNRKTTILTVMAVMVAVVGIGAVNAAVTNSETVESYHPDSETYEADLNFSGGGTDVTAEVYKDGTLVKDKTLSYADVSGSNATLSVPFTGLSEGTFTVDLNATDETNVTVDQTRMVVDTGTIDATDQDVIVDVGFNATSTTTADIYVNDSSTGSVENSTTVTFDPVQYTDGSGTISQDLYVDTDSNVSTKVVVEGASGYDGAWAQKDEEAAFTLGNAEFERQDIFLLGGILAVVVVLSKREVI